ncbi:unnamed protein product [Clonostachys rosea f. rosea IK726]|uniref:Uncharacterized protein n=1 Tax=Clonostachys rosea f. rosea IK726 TaxID=1349383 RepID=A0ACA9UM44_BIOOC|nr:unnamed protein product [Clonostachys rosea f. rosea IK726]
MEFLKGRSTPSGTRKTTSKKNDARFSNDDDRSNERRRTDSRPVSSAIDAATMLQSLSWLRVGGAPRSDPRTRMVEDARDHEHHHFEPQAPSQQYSQSRAPARPKVSIPIEYRYHNAPPTGGQFAIPTHNTPNIAWPLAEIEVDKETFPFDDIQHDTQSPQNSSIRGSISPISAYSARPGRNPSIGSNIPLESAGCALNNRAFDHGVRGVFTILNYLFLTNFTNRPDINITIAPDSYAFS